jgi:hypothetical protein
LFYKNRIQEIDGEVSENFSMLVLQTILSVLFSLLQLWQYLLDLLKKKNLYIDYVSSTITLLIYLYLMIIVNSKSFKQPIDVLYWKIVTVLPFIVFVTTLLIAF